MKSDYYTWEGVAAERVEAAMEVNFGVTERDRGGFVSRGREGNVKANS